MASDDTGCSSAGSRAAAPALVPKGSPRDGGEARVFDAERLISIQIDGCCSAHLLRMFFSALGSAPEAADVRQLIVEPYEVEYESAESGVLGTEYEKP